VHALLVGVQAKAARLRARAAALAARLREFGV